MSEDLQLEIGFCEESDEDSVDSDTPGKGVVAARKSRGNARVWSEPLLDQTGAVLLFTSIDELLLNAAARDLSRKNTNKNHTFNFRCKTNSCPYLLKYCKSLHGLFTAHDCYDHTHESDLSDGHRGLSQEQKVVVIEAIESNNKSARVIINFFRDKRKRLVDENKLAHFPPDPPIMKINNFLQAYKKKKSNVYNPTPLHLTSWCDDNGPSTVDKEDESTYNTPFVMGYQSVSFNFLLFFVIYIF